MKRKAGSEGRVSPPRRASESIQIELVGSQQDRNKTSHQTPDHLIVLIIDGCHYDRAIRQMCHILLINERKYYSLCFIFLSRYPFMFLHGSRKGGIWSLFLLVLECW